MEEIVQNRRQWMQTVSCGTAGIALAGVTDIAFAQAAKPFAPRVVDKAAYNKVVAGHKGKVVVVDCWATWCVPCRKAFPKTVELSKAYAGKVAVVSLSFDDLKNGEVPTKVTEFLEKQEAQFDNLVSSLDISEEGADAFAIPGGALPHFKIYGRDGRLFKVFESGANTEFTHEEIESAVKAALKAK
ncbi:MAG: TlpA family protein disulfide reductase [Planctomycetes bacterium]|nr:TlpA family protein disulfide reductase [Planctomycetota bacterium]